MNSNEEFKTKFIYDVSSTLNLNFDEQKKITDILSVILVDYEINKKVTDLAVSDITEKIVMFLQAKKIEGMSANTIENYFYTLRKLSIYFNKQVKDITINDLRYFIQIECEGLSECTVNNKISYTQNFFKWLVDEEIIDKDVSKKLKRIKEPLKLRKPLTMEEIERLRISCKDSRDRAILEFLLSTGCRVSEITNINISDIDFNKNCVSVVGKGNKERIVYFNEKTRLYINNYIQERKGDNEALFIGVKKPYERLGTRAIEKIINKIAIRANFDKSVFPHLLRHTFATQGLRQGANIYTIKFLLGHTSVMTTERYIEIDADNVKHEYHKHMIN